jgi:hypothetical protein
MLFFCMLEKHNRLFLEVFRGGLDFFDPKIALRAFWDQKSLGPLDKPLEIAVYIIDLEKKRQNDTEKRKDNFFIYINHI